MRRVYHSGRLHWCLTVEWAGQVFRWATSPLEIDTEAGDTLAFDDGLEPIDYEDSLQGLGVASSRSIAVEIFFPTDVDVANLISQGHDLSSATGEISLWSEDTVWEERRVVLSGPVREPEYGGPDEPVAFSVEDGLQSSGVLTHGRQQVVSEAAWPDSDEEDWGKAYPIVWGEPGVLQDTNGTCAGSPAIAVAWVSGEATKAVIAGHKVGSSTCIAFNGDGNTSTLIVYDELDGLGQPVSTIDLTAASFDTTGSEYWVSWYAGTGLLDAAGTSIVSVGQVCAHLLDQADIPIDRAAWDSFTALLSGIKIDGYIDEAVSPWEWIADNVLPLVPFSVLPGPDGFYPVLWALSADPSEAVCTLSPDDDPDVEREDRLTYSKLSDVVNSLSVGYAIDPQGSEARRRLTVGGVPNLDAGEQGSYYCALSEQRFGLREDELDSDIVWRSETAAYMLARRVERDALPSREVSYSVSYSYGWLRLGDVVQITDSEVSLEDALALVIGLRWESEEQLSVRLLIPARPELQT